MESQVYCFKLQYLGKMIVMASVVIIMTQSEKKRFIAFPLFQL